MSAHGIMFHHFSGQGHPEGQGTLTADELAEMIRHIGPERILPAREWYRRAMMGALCSRDICLTFDDSLRCQYDVAVPVLRSFGLTAFFFVYTSIMEGTAEPLEIYRYYRTTCFKSVDEFYAGFFASLDRTYRTDFVANALANFNPAAYLEDFPFYSDNDRRFRYLRDEVLGPEQYHKAMQQMMRDSNCDVAAWFNRLWMDDAALRELHADGHVIGLHSHSHPTRLERLPADQQAEEYARNHAHLAQALGESPLTMSHPCNSYNRATLNVLYDLGIRMGFRANVAQSCYSLLELPREDHANVLRRMKAAGSSSQSTLKHAA